MSPRPESALGERISFQGSSATSFFNYMPIFHDTPMSSKIFAEADAAAELVFFLFAQRKNQIGFILVDPIGIFEHTSKRAGAPREAPARNYRLAAFDQKKNLIAAWTTRWPCF